VQGASRPVSAAAAAAAAAAQQAIISDRRLSSTVCAVHVTQQSLNSQLAVCRQLPACLPAFADYYSTT